MKVSGYNRRGGDRDYTPRNRVSSLEDLDQSLAARYPGTVESLRLNFSMAKVGSALALIYNSGRRHGREFDPIFERMGSDLASIPWRVDLGLDEALQSVILALLGSGMEMAAVTAVVQNFVWDLVTQVSRQASQGQASNYSVAIAEEYKAIVARGSMASGVSPQVLAALRLGMNQGSQAPAAASGPGGPLNSQDGPMTRGLWQVGRFAGAGDAGYNSWHDNRERTVSKETRDSASGAGVKIDSTTKSTVTTGPNQSLPQGPGGTP